jgi:pimeloyl-ACP methyl ester carboxylesterase
MPFFEHDGCRLHYLEEGSGPLVVLVPGNTAGARHMARELQQLAGEGYRAAALDLRGTGASQRLDDFDDTWLHQCAGDVAALAAHLVDDAAVVVGVSGGALIALLCAAAHPAAVRAVVADSFTPVLDEQLLRTRIEERSRPSELQQQFWAYGHGDDWVRVVDADTRWMQGRIDDSGVDVTAVLEDVGVPTCLTGSLHDEMVPDVADQLVATATRVAQCEVHLYA